MAGARGNRRIFDLGNKTLFMREYGDFSPEYTDYATAAVAILPVPYDGTSTWIKGADKGPEALLDASFNLEFYDIETDTEVFRRGIATLEPVTEDASPEAMAAAVEQRMDRVIADGKFPVLIGGEHSVSIGAFRSMGKRYGDELSIVQFDAHSDMRDSYEGSTHNHACVMARALEVTRSVTQVGIRSSDRSELRNINPERIFHAHVIKGKSGWEREVARQLKPYVYITIDLDVLDPAEIIAAVGIIDGGMTMAEVSRTINDIANEKELVALTVAEHMPRTAMRMQMLLGSLPLIGR